MSNDYQSTMARVTRTLGETNPGVAPPMADATVASNVIAINANIPGFQTRGGPAPQEQAGSVASFNAGPLAPQQLLQTKAIAEAAIATEALAMNPYVPNFLQGNPALRPQTDTSDPRPETPSKWLDIAINSDMNMAPQKTASTQAAPSPEANSQYSPSHWSAPSNTPSSAPSPVPT